VTSKSLNLRDFSQVHVFDQMRVVLSQGDYSIEVLAEDNLLDLISVDKQGDVLRIERVANQGEKIQQNSPMIVKISAPNFSAVKGNHQSEIILEGLLKGASLDIELRQQSNFRGEVNMGDLNINCGQQSNASIEGVCELMQLVLFDQSSLQAGKLLVKTIEIEMNRQTQATLNPTELISGRLSDNSSLFLKGDVKENKVQVSRMAKMSI
jgi:hypothetical protein